MILEQLANGIHERIGDRTGSVHYDIRIDEEKISLEGTIEETPRIVLAMIARDLLRKIKDKKHQRDIVRIIKAELEAEREEIIQDDELHELILQTLEEDTKL